jgi:hypothetical protein
MLPALLIFFVMLALAFALFGVLRLAGVNALVSVMLVTAVFAGVSIGSVLAALA